MDPQEEVLDATPDSSTDTPAVETGVDSPASSPDADQGAKRSALDVVAEAVSDGIKAKQEPEKQAEPPSVAKGEEQKPEADPQQGKADDDRLDKHPRFRQVLEKAKAFEDKAQRLDSLATYLTDAGLSTDDFAQGLEIMRQIKQDPFSAYEALRPIMENLELVVGQRLPADLQDRVDRGLVDPETAKELAAMRTRSGLERYRAEKSQAQIEAERRAAQEAALQRQRSETSEAVRSAVSAWESEWKGSDPDYGRKSPLVIGQIHALIQAEGFPDSPEKAVDQAKRARAAVEQHLKGMLPQPKPKSPIPSGSSGKATPQSSTPLDVVRNALGG